MMTRNGVGDDDGTIRATLRFRWSLVVGIGVQTVALVGWLVQMHSDIGYLKTKNEEQDRQIIRYLESRNQRLEKLDERQQVMYKLLLETNAEARKALEAILQHMNNMKP